MFLNKVYQSLQIKIYRTLQIKFTLHILISSIKSFRFWNLSLGWLSFIISAVVYLLTLEPTVSWWDCGEFISCAYKLEVGHPPGAPLYQMLGRIFSLFAGNPEKVAMMINSLSALASAFTILFLFWTITHLARKFFNKNKDFSVSELILIMGSGLVGALAYTFSDTFWFSAVEGEVYATSSLFTAVVFWAILKWENVADEPHSTRWLILIAYLMGLSIGVHLLNLLAIPAIVLIYYFSKYRVSLPGLLKALGISLLILAFIMYGIINGLVKMASVFELLFVNGFRLPFSSGLIFYAPFIILLIVFGIWYTHKYGKVLWNTIILCITVILIGYSSFAMIIIRSHANPPLDENNPENVFSLLSYLNREQYGNRPLVFGHFYSDEIARNEDGFAVIKESNPVYRKNTAKGMYEIAYRKSEYTYSKSSRLFPRIYSRDAGHIKEYKYWGGIDNNKPGIINSAVFFINYQLGHMYIRYFMWNFAGRQNDTQSNGSLLNGNWMSGIKFLDEKWLGDQDLLPDKYKDSKSRNRYFLLPLILGMLGILFHSSKRNRDFWVIMTLFLMTGIAIVIYLNQTPLQPRERDYAYAGSFYAFCIWIGLGVFGLFDILRKKMQNNLTASLTAGLCLFFVPGRMASENWDDHDRSGRYITRDIAKNYLASCEKNAILFTNGDNDTFPLWYVQEVEGFRTDIRVVNLMLLNTDWYIDQMKLKSYESDPLPITLPFRKYADGVNGSIYFRNDPNKIRLTTLIQGFESDHPVFKEKSRRGDILDVLPAGNLLLDVDTNHVIANGTVRPENRSLIESPMTWTLKDNPISKANLIQLDLLAHNDWQRPVYFVTGGNDGSLNLENYFQHEGLAYRLVPLKTAGGDTYLRLGRVDTDILYKNLMENFSWGRMNEPDVYMDYYNIRTFGVIRFRNNFIRLAEELIKEGKKDSAIMALNRCMELSPDKSLPYDQYISGATYSRGKDKGEIHYPGIIEMYYKCGEYEKGNRLLIEHFKILKQDIDYYKALSRIHKPRFENEMFVSRNYLNELINLAKTFNQKELLKQLSNLN